jgi:cellulose synthase/poly-beta-1,6-N-acetylglucosamine synthase-like glycosyltransferase
MNSLALGTFVLDSVGIPVAMGSSYLGGLALLSRVPHAQAGNETARFDIIVPAHDEENGIGATLASLAAIEYPASKFRVVVVADNCSDQTAQRARAAGALVLERNDPTRRGKGYALAHGYERSLADGLADAVVVIDADTLVSSNLLRAFSVCLSAGELALQAEYGVSNGSASWRTRLMVIAFALFHAVRSLGRERLGVSCGLRGNGMCFSTSVLRRVPPSAFSIVEDIEYGIALGLAGVRVCYVHAAKVWGEMPATTPASRTQRERWEFGRWQLARKHAPDLIRNGISRRSLVLLDLALDLMIPPLTWLVALAFIGMLLSLLAVVNFAVPSAVLYPWILAFLGLCIYVVRGLQLSGGGGRAILDLLLVPTYAVWKLSLLLLPGRRSHNEWVRTARSDAS